MKNKLLTLAAALMAACLLFCGAAYGMAEQWARTFPESGVPVLMYHSISSKYDSSICVSEKQFRAQMEWLRDNGYHAVSIDEFYEALAENGALPEKPVLITFDDGFKDNYKAAWPILKEYSFTGTFFVVTGKIDSYNLDWDELKQLIEDGNSIGSHSVTHRDLSCLSAAQQEKELRESKRTLEEGLGTTIKAFCFPFGKYNKTTLSLLPELGYSLSFTTRSGKVCFGDNEYLLKRVHVEGGMSMANFKKQVSYE